MININILAKGDEVLSINEHFLAVKRKDGTVDIYKVFLNSESELTIDPLKTAVIGYGEGAVEKVLDDDTKVFTF